MSRIGFSFKISRNCFRQLSKFRVSVKLERPDYLDKEDVLLSGLNKGQVSIGI